MELFKEIMREKEVILVKDKQTTKPVEIGLKCNNAKLWTNSVFSRGWALSPTQKNKCPENNQRLKWSTKHPIFIAQPDPQLRKGDNPQRAVPLHRPITKPLKGKGLTWQITSQMVGKAVLPLYHVHITKWVPIQCTNIHIVPTLVQAQW